MRFILLISFIVLYLISAVVVGLVIYHSSLNRTKSSLEKITQRVQENIKYQNGKWDISEYSSNSLIPGRFRMYVFASNGFVVERWRPIQGFLDISDFKNLEKYKKPETVHAMTNQKYRVLSKPIVDDANSKLGVITVSSFNPNKGQLSETDKKLEDAAKIVAENIAVDEGNIKVDNVDARYVQFDVAFQIVDRYNRVLAQSNNSSSVDKIPNFIDPSYVHQEIETNSFRKVSSKDEDGIFLVKSEALLDNNTPYGVVVAALTIASLYSLMKTYLIASVIIGVFLVIAFWVIVVRVTRNEKNDNQFKTLKLADIKSIGFSKKACLIKINDQEIPIAYATNQYYMCQALFASPTKKWETDELLEKFGEESFNSDGWRKVYDSMTSINKKASEVIDYKLIVSNNKTYRINPLLAKKIK